jgi:hypothetical protein
MCLLEYTGSNSYLLQKRKSSRHPPPVFKVSTVMRNIFCIVLVAVLATQMPSSVSAQEGTAGKTIGSFYYATNISGYANSSLDVMDIHVSLSVT